MTWDDVGSTGRGREESGDRVIGRSGDRVIGNPRPMKPTPIRDEVGCQGMSREGEGWNRGDRETRMQARAPALHEFCRKESLWTSKSQQCLTRYGYGPRR